MDMQQGAALFSGDDTPHCHLRHPVRHGNARPAETQQKRHGADGASQRLWALHSCTRWGRGAAGGPAPRGRDRAGLARRGAGGPAGRDARGLHFPAPCQPRCTPETPTPAPTPRRLRAAVEDPSPCHRHEGQPGFLVAPSSPCGTWVLGSPAQMARPKAQDLPRFSVRLKWPWHLGAPDTSVKLTGPRCPQRGTRGGQDAALEPDRVQDWRSQMLPPRSDQTALLASTPCSPQGPYGQDSDR